MRECFNMVTQRPAPAYAASRLWAGGRQIRRSRRARFDQPGNGRCRAHAGALRLQTRPQDCLAPARQHAPAAINIRTIRITAFCRHNHVELEGAPDGPLRGLTFAVKDVFDIAGHRTGNGNPVWLETHPPATRTASAVERVLAAGAQLVGKTHTDEIGLQPQRRERAPRHADQSARAGPHSRRLVERIGGGGCRRSRRLRAWQRYSGGSVRLPASYCGIYGIRTTHGLVPADALSIWPKASTRSAGSPARQQ